MTESACCVKFLISFNGKPDSHSNLDFSLSHNKVVLQMEERGLPWKSVTWQSLNLFGKFKSHISKPFHKYIVLFAIYRSYLQNWLVLWQKILRVRKINTLDNSQISHIQSIEMPWIRQPDFEVYRLSSPSILILNIIFENFVSFFMHLSNQTTYCNTSEILETS